MTRKGSKVTRRRLLQAGAGLAAGAALGPAGAEPAPARQSVRGALGVKHATPATGTVPALGGSRWPPGFAAAGAAAARHFVNLIDLHDKVGERIAKLVGVEAALVTTGAAG